MTAQSSQPVFLAGPTASGKSAVALLLAERIGGEIIAVDSMQVYRGLDVGTAKPSRAEQEKIPHHLIDVADLHESFDAARFCRLAEKAVAEIQARGRVPIFCGGTGFYCKAYLEGLGEAPPANRKLRAELEALPFADLLCELAERDAETFAKIDQRNPRRVLRAVEVIRLTGKPFSAQRADWQKEKTVIPRMFGLTRARADLQQRIDQRVEEMFRRGLVPETEKLLLRGLEKNQTATQAIGYRQVIAHLRGETTLPETIELVKIRTRQFAKRQLTWFRRQMHLRWISLAADTAAETVASQIFDLIDNGKFH
ncbi:MAG: tRNA (adenosine(37)-N6)-dimethylallyltransferase MiaA [Verrucomicrobiota bacterium]